MRRATEQSQCMEVLQYGAEYFDWLLVQRAIMLDHVKELLKSKYSGECFGSHTRALTLIASTPDHDCRTFPYEGHDKIGHRIEIIAYSDPTKLFPTRGSLALDQDKTLRSLLNCAGEIARLQS